MRYFFNLVTALLLCVLATAGSAWAAEEGEVNSAAAIQENDDEAELLELSLPIYMLPPENNLYPAKVNTTKALGVFRVGLSLAAADFLWLIPHCCLFPTSWIGLTFHYGIGNFFLIQQLIVVPLLNYFAGKTNVWQFYDNNLGFDTAAWTLFAIGAGLRFANNFLWLADLNIVLLDVMVGVAGLASIASIILFAVKAKICYKMAKAAQKYNKEKQGSALLSGKRRVAVMPSFAPFQDKERKISGSTMGIALTF